MSSEYQHLYTGPRVSVAALVAALEKGGIQPVIKDETESGRLAGFAPPVFNQSQIFVHQDEWEAASDILSDFQSSDEASL